MARFTHCGLTICALVVSEASGISFATAQPVIDQFVAGAQVVAKKECALLTVNFNTRLQYAGHVPSDKGDELRVTLTLIDREAATARRLSPREGVRVDNAKLAGIRAVTLDLDRASSPILRIQFERPLSFKVVQIGTFEGIGVLISLAGSPANCSMESFGRTGGSSKGTVLRGDSRDGAAAPTRGKTKSSGKISDAEIKSIEASMDEARAAMQKGKFEAAIQLLKMVLKFPENKYSAEAQELVGVARQRAGQTADARAEYEDYLRRYSSGEGADRVRQRLSGILTAMGSPQEKLKGDNATVPGKPGNRKLGPDDELRWTQSGSVSSFYILDDSSTTLKDISTAPNPNADPDSHRVHQHQLLSNYDLYGTIENNAAKSKYKFAVTEEHHLSPNSDTIGVSTALVETTLKDSDIMLRVGRQSRNTGGVIGRFDGGLLSWQATDFVRLNAVAGSPNWSRFDAPFKDGKDIYGLSADFGKVLGGLETSVFAIQQRADRMIDRQGVGAEFRYFDMDKSALATIDYDVHFQQLNAAIFSGSWTLPDKSVVTTALNYQRSPYLSSWNALQGQPFLTLYDMLNSNTKEQIRQLAIDRTPVFSSAMFGYSRPLTDKLQVSVDATITNLSGTPPSGGVDGTPASGTEYYFSAQLTGSGIFKPGDMFATGLRYASLADSNAYVLDFNTLYPINNDWRVGPRLRVGYRSGKDTDLKETTVLPSILLNYLLTKDLGLELEVGAKWTSSEQGGIKSTSLDLTTTAGFRYDFHADGVNKCAGKLAMCILTPGIATPAAATPGDTGKSPYYKSAPSFASAFVVETGLRYWHSSAKNEYSYYADPTPTQMVSHLSYLDLAAHSGEVFFRVDAVQGPLRNFFLKGYIGGGVVSGGNLLDEDFPPFIDPYSKTQSETKGKLRYGSVDLGYSVYTDKNFRVGVFTGYHYWSESVDASGCSQVGSDPFICGMPLPNSIKVITEQDRWNAIRFGGVVDVKLTDRLKWTGEFAYAVVSQQAQDTHYFTFGADPASGKGSGFQAETVLTYNFTDKFSVGIGGRWWHYKTDATDSFNQLLQYQTDRYGMFAQGSVKF